jgi:probable HAF family extracellular repeat protein
LYLEVLEGRLAPSYSIADLGTLGGTSSQALALNNTGQVTGTSKLAGDQVAHAFLYNPSGSMLDLGTLGGANSDASGISSGFVVGRSETASGATHAFVYNRGAMTDLGTLGGLNSGALSVNRVGQVAGYSNVSGSYQHAFRYQNGKMKDLGTLGGLNSVATAIDAKGNVVGYADLVNTTHAFFSNGLSRMRDLGTLGGTRSYAYDINDKGQIAGDSTTATGEDHVFLIDKGHMSDLGVVSDGNAVALNNVGEIVGDMNGTPALYSNGVVTDLNDLLPPGSGWVITTPAAFDINDAGQIAGWGTVNGQTHAFLMTPDRGQNGAEPALRAALGIGNLPNPDRVADGAPGVFLFGKDPAAAHMTPPSADNAPTHDKGEPAVQPRMASALLVGPRLDDLTSFGFGPFGVLQSGGQVAEPAHGLLCIL